VDGKRIASGGGGQTARIWDTETGQELLTLKGHSSSVDAVAFSPDGHRIVTGSADSTIRVWDAEATGETVTLDGQSPKICSVAFSPDGQRIVSGTDNEGNRMWDAATGRILLKIAGTLAAFSPMAGRLSPSRRIRPGFVMRRPEVSCANSPATKIW
jgi:WD40 repeat protein